MYFLFKVSVREDHDIFWREVSGRTTTSRASFTAEVLPTSIHSAKNEVKITLIGYKDLQKNSNAIVDVFTSFLHEIEVFFPNDHIFLAKSRNTYLIFSYATPTIYFLVCKKKPVDFDDELKIRDVRYDNITKITIKVQLFWRLPYET